VRQRVAIGGHALPVVFVVHELGARAGQGNGCRISRARTPMNSTTDEDEATKVRARPAAKSPNLPEHKVIASLSGCTVLTAGNYLIHYANGPGTLESVRALVQACEELCSVHERVGYLSILGNSPDFRIANDVRIEIEAMVKRFASRYAAAAIVFAGQGFAATAARSVVTSVNIATQAQHPNRVFPDLDSALPWLKERFPEGTPDAGGLRALTQMLMSAVGAPRTPAVASVVAARPEPHAGALLATADARGPLRAQRRA
jgi:hypothetical protein